MQARRLRIVSLAVICAIPLFACSKKPETPTNPSPTDPIVYTALGASDAIGYGSTVPCVPFTDCPAGRGYVYLLRTRLEGSGKTVTFNNRGIPGAVLSPAIQTLARQIGRDDIIANLIDQEAPFVPSGTTHLTVFAGGNDANAIGQAVRAGQGGNDVRGFIDRQVQQWGSDYRDMIARLRARVPNARLVALNLPNLAGMPYVANNTIEERGVLQRIAVGLTVYSTANLSGDGFHPSDSGYQVMADLAYPVLANGTATAPASSCAQRTLVPVF